MVASRSSREREGKPRGLLFSCLWQWTSRQGVRTTGRVLGVSPLILYFIRLYLYIYILYIYSINIFANSFTCILYPPLDSSM